MATVAAMLGAVAMIGAGGVMAAPALADDTAATAGGGSIEIESPQKVNGDNMIAPSVNGRVFNAYELGSYENVTLNKDQSEITGYSLANASGIDNAEVMKWIDSAAAGMALQALNDVMACTGSGTSTTCTFKGAAANLTPLQFVARYFYGTGSDAYGNNHADQPLMRRFAQAAAASGVLKPATKQSVVGTNNEVLFQGLTPGLYLITEASVPGSASTGETVARAMITGTTYPLAGGKDITSVVDASTTPATTFELGKLYLKAEKVMVAKDVVDAGKPINDQLARAKSARTFAITTNVPNYDEYTNWTSPQFSISDSPTNLTLDTGSVTVTATTTDGTAKTTSLKKGTDYTVTSNADGGFTVTLDAPRALSGDSIKIVYSAVVADVTAADTMNTATVKFSKDPLDPQALGAVDATRNVYVAAIPFQKIKYNDPNTVLAGAVFDVTDANGNPVKFDVNAADNVYSVDPASARANANQIVSNSSSIMLVGLGADANGATKYTFTERKAPTGYILGNTPVSFTLTVTPKYEGNALAGVSYRINGDEGNSGNFANFVDSSEPTVQAGSVVASPKSNTTEFEGGMIRVENTTNASDFAKTGGEITRALVIVAVLAVIGAVFLVAARVRRSRMQG